jgi:hypothetical protein
MNENNNKNIQNMKIQNLISDCKHAATIKIMCGVHGQTMSDYETRKVENLVRAGVKFFVFIDKTGISIVEMPERSILLARIISGRVSRSTVLFFHDGAIRQITRKNMAESWRLIAPQKVIERDEREEIPRRERTAFDDAMPGRPYKKMNQRGFTKTHNSNEAMERFIHI